MQTLAKLLFVALLLVATPAASETVWGVTVNRGLACTVDDLSTKSMGLITRWFVLNMKVSGPEGAGITKEEFEELKALVESGTCGYLPGEIPILIVLSDGTLNLGELPGGKLVGFPASSFRRMVRVCDEGGKQCINIPEQEVKL